MDRSNSWGLRLLATCIVLVIAGAVFLTGRSYKAKKDSYTACYEKLRRVKSGLEKYVAENESFPEGIDEKGEGLCNFILTGYGDAQECAGMVEPDVANYCSDYSMSVVDATSWQYEITGHTKGNCCIVITESHGLPEKYGDCKEECPAPLH